MGVLRPLLTGDEQELEPSEEEWEGRGGGRGEHAGLDLQHLLQHWLAGELLQEGEHLAGQLGEQRPDQRRLLWVQEGSLAELRGQADAAGELEAQVVCLQQQLATAEIKFTDLEQTVESRADQVEQALEEQKQCYDKRHKEVITAQDNKWQGKMKKFCEIANEKVF